MKNDSMKVEDVKKDEQWKVVSEPKPVERTSKAGKKYVNYVTTIERDGVKRDLWLFNFDIKRLDKSTKGKPVGAKITLRTEEALKMGKPITNDAGEPYMNVRLDSVVVAL